MGGGGPLKETMEADERGLGMSLFAVFRRLAIEGNDDRLIPGIGGVGLPGIAGAAPVGGFGAEKDGGFGAEREDDSGSDRYEESGVAGFH
jgi:hypothetical protein